MDSVGVQFNDAIVLTDNHKYGWQAHRFFVVLPRHLPQQFVSRAEYPRQTSNDTLVQINIPRLGLCVRIHHQPSSQSP